MSRNPLRTKTGLAAGLVLFSLVAVSSAQVATIVHRYDFENDGPEDSLGTLDGILQGDPAFSGQAKSGARSIELDGDGDYLDFPDPLDFTGQFSLATWLWPEPGALGIQNLIANAPGGWATDGFKLYYNTWSDPSTADNALIMETGNSGGAGNAYRSGAGAITEGTWNHVIATVDTSAGEIRFYVDGLEAVGTGGLIADMNVNLDWEIGAMKSGWNLAGLIDDFQIYSGILTAAEVDWLFSNPGLIIGDLPAELTWDGNGPNNWNSPHWLDGPPDVPDNRTGVILPATSSDTVTVAEDGVAFSLGVDGGGIAIADGRSLTVGTAANFAAGTSLSLGADATLTIGGSGAIDALTTAGSATISARGDLPVATFDAAGATSGTFVKQGLGTLRLDNSSGAGVFAANTTFQIDAGTLASQGADPLGGSTALRLNGGTLSVGTKTITHRYDFESDDGEDSIGGLDGSIQGGPTFSDDAMSGSRSIVLAGGPDHVDFGGAMDFGNQFSLALWVKPDSSAPDQIQTMIANSPGGYETDGFRFFYNLWNTGNGQLILEAGNGAAGSSHASDEEGVITEGDWNHIVAAVNVGTGEVAFYLDGSELPGGGTIVTDLNTNSDWEIGRMEGGLELTGMLDDVQIYGGLLTGEQAAWLYDNPGSAIESVLDMSGTSVALTADSGILANSAALFGELTMDAAVLSTSGSGGIRFSGTTISPGVGAVGFHTEVPTSPGPIDAPAAPLAVTKSGTSDLVLDADAGTLQDTTFDVQEGRLIGLQDATNPMAGATIGLSGGELVLAGAAAGTDVTFDNPVTVAGESTVTAGAGGVGAAGPLTATLGSGTHGVTLNGGTLELRSSDNYTLDVAGNIVGNGAIRVARGSVILSGAANVVDNLSISGGKVDTGGNDLSVGIAMRLGTANFRAETGDPFTVSGPDLLDPATPRTLTLSGGTLSVVNSPIRHRYDFESDDGADWVGNLDGQVQGDPTFSDEAMSGDRSIELDGAGDYLDFPDPLDFGAQFSVATWVWPEPEALGIQNLVANAPGGAGTDGFKLFYNTWSDPSTADNALLMETGNGTDGTAYATGGGTITEGQWNHVVATVDTTAGEVHLYVDGSEEAGSGGLVTDMSLDLDWEIGAMKSGWNLAGLIDDFQIYGQVLSAEEVRHLYENPGAIVEGELDLSSTSVKVTADSTFQVNTSEDLVLADLTLEAGVAVKLAGAPAASIRDVFAGDGSSIEGLLVVRGTLFPGEGPGTLTVDGELEMEDESGYFCELGDGANDLLTSTGDVFVGNTLTLQAISSLGAVGDHQRTIISVGEEGTIVGEFAVAPAPDDHLGHGVFHQAVDYAEESTTVDVFQAAAGDIDGNRLVNNADLQLILAANSFNNGPGFGWTEGDFDGDWDVDNADLQLVLATGYFGKTEPYAAAGAEIASGGVSIVPEPGTLMLLLSSAVALWILRRR